MSILYCSKQVTKPGYINFDITNDSIFVNAINKNKSPFHIVVNRNTKAVTDTLVILENDTKTLLGFSLHTIDTLTILENYQFKAAFGNPKIQSVDTLFN